MSEPELERPKNSIMSFSVSKIFSNSERLKVCVNKFERQKHDYIKSCASQNFNINHVRLKT